MFSKNNKKTKKIINTLPKINKLKNNKLNNNKLNNNKLNNSKFTFRKDSKYNIINNKPKTIKQLCEFYKKDINNKINMPLYKSCKINQYCRKYKCNDIDKKFKNLQIKKLGTNYNTLLLSSLHNKCSSTLEDTKQRKKCYNSALLKFYKYHNLANDYAKVLECDKKTCAKEKKIFNNNLFLMHKKKQKNTKFLKLLKIEDLPDNQMIEIN
jgi:hypothetical protein